MRFSGRIADGPGTKVKGMVFSPPQSAAPMSVAVDVDRHIIPHCSAARSDGRLQLFEPEQERLIHEWDGHAKGAVRIAFSPDDKQIISMGDDGLIKIWSADGRHCLKELPRNNKAWRRLTGKPNEIGSVIVDGGESGFRDSLGEPFAWYADSLMHVGRSPKAWMWAASTSVHVVLLTLDGNADALACQPDDLEGIEAHL